MTLRWDFLAFDQLDVHTLYAVLRLRTEVFVMEQQCLFQDMDNTDQEAMHLLGWDGAGRLSLYARCYGPGVKFAEASIGRVITAPHVRGTGAGHTLMREATHRVCAHWGQQPIRLGAQERLRAFYEQHGFAVASAPYDEDGIPHIEMLRA